MTQQTTTTITKIEDVFTLTGSDNMDWGDLDCQADALAFASKVIRINREWAEFNIIMDC